MERLNILFLTYYFPPQKFPRSIQISHLVQYLRKDFNITVVTSEPENEGDPSLLSFTPLDNVVYAPKSNLTKIIESSKGHLIKKEILPDFQYLWHFDLFRKTRVLIDDSSPDVIITFGQPMSTHIAGVKLKQQFPHIKWLAHFSDPWVDNIFNDYNAWTKWINKYYQDSVLKSADRLIFTSQETIDLVTKYYPGEVRKKSICLPHTFNQDLYVSKEDQRNEKITLRYIGNFYGNRKPDSLLKALQLLSPKKRAQIRVEFIGSSTESIKDMIHDHMMEDIVFTYPPVSYIHSIELMHSADILLVIDAPTEKSPFLPSKLIDYIGANKPILGIVPPGASRNLIEEIGFPTADPRNITEISNKIMQLVETFSKYTVLTIPELIRERFSLHTGGMRMKNIIEGI